MLAKSGRRLHTKLHRSLLLSAVFAAGLAGAAPVLMISVDGLKPEYVLDADAHGLKIPFLRSLLREGAYARGVTGVWPTVTYPSHTTLLTGVTPAAHGIYNNLQFDPARHYAEAWLWYAEQIRVPTLWQAARDAGLSTASIGWPVSVGAPVDFLIPEYWRIFRPTAELDPADAHLIAALSLPKGMLQTMQLRLGPYMRGNDPSPNGDEIKTRFALDILQAKKPQFMTLHLSSLDEEEHEHGPFSAEANQDLEMIDGCLAQLFAAARANHPDAIALVVSDHGFVQITQRLNLFPPFLHAGLIELGTDAKGKTGSVTAWKAQPWTAGGMAAVMLNAADAATENRVRDLLRSLGADSGNGIAEILERGAIKERGGFPDAAFLIVMRPGFAVFSDPSGPMVSEVSGSRGSHGFSPDQADMRAAFFIAGRGIAHHRDLGVIDMRSIAPTVAQLLHVKLPTAPLAPLPIGP